MLAAGVGNAEIDFSGEVEGFGVWDDADVEGFEGGREIGGHVVVVEGDDLEIFVGAEPADAGDAFEEEPGLAAVFCDGSAGAGDDDGDEGIAGDGVADAVGFGGESGCCRSGVLAA